MVTFAGPRPGVSGKESIGSQAEAGRPREKQTGKGLKEVVSGFFGFVREKAEKFGEDIHSDTKAAKLKRLMIVVMFGLNGFVALKVWDMVEKKRNSQKEKIQQVKDAELRQRLGELTARFDQLRQFFERNSDRLTNIHAALQRGEIRPGDEEFLQQCEPFWHEMVRIQEELAGDINNMREAYQREAAESAPDSSGGKEPGPAAGRSSQTSKPRANFSQNVNQAQAAAGTQNMAQNSDQNSPKHEDDTYSTYIDKVNKSSFEFQGTVFNDPRMARYIGRQKLENLLSKGKRIAIKDSLDSKDYAILLTAKGNDLEFLRPDGRKYSYTLDQLLNPLNREYIFFEEQNDTRAIGYEQEKPTVPEDEVIEEKIQEDDPPVVDSGPADVDKPATAPIVGEEMDEEVVEGEFAEISPSATPDQGLQDDVDIISPVVDADEAVIKTNADNQAAQEESQVDPNLEVAAPPPVDQSRESFEAKSSSQQPDSGAPVSERLAEIDSGNDEGAPIPNAEQSGAASEVVVKEPVLEPNSTRAAPSRIENGKNAENILFEGHELTYEAINRKLENLLAVPLIGDLAADYGAIFQAIGEPIIYPFDSEKVKAQIVEVANKNESVLGEGNKFTDDLKLYAKFRYLLMTQNKVLEIIARELESSSRPQKAEPPQMPEALAREKAAVEVSGTQTDLPTGDRKIPVSAEDSKDVGRVETEKDLGNFDNEFLRRMIEKKMLPESAKSRIDFKKQPQVYESGVDLNGLSESERLNITKSNFLEYYRKGGDPRVWFYPEEFKKFLALPDNFNYQQVLDSANVASKFIKTLIFQHGLKNLPDYFTTAYVIFCDKYIDVANKKIKGENA